MGGGSSNKPIVFVFGAKKGDADGRKKNLSAINTQVAYRAHERRREKNLKSRLRAQAKEDVPFENSLPTPTSSISPSSSTKIEPDVNFEALSKIPNSQHPNFAADPAEQPLPRTSQQSILSDVFVNNSSLARARPDRLSTPRRLLGDRRESDIASDISSEQENVNIEIWSTSPSSACQLTPATDLSSTSPSGPIHINSYFDQSLDPFFKLPAVASAREKWLVHFYFREMGHIGFGTHSNALFCPDRDWVSQYVSSKSLCFQWILILAEEHLARVGVLQDQTNAIERKAKAYGSLNSVLRSRSVDRDEGITGIMYAVVVDTARTSMHLMALDRLINETGGFDAFLDGPLGIAHPEHVATVYAFGRCPIANLKDVEAIKSRFLNTIYALYSGARIEQEEKKRIRNRRPWDTLSRQVVDGNGVLVPANHDEHFRYYIKAQQDCFSSICIAQLLNTTLQATADYASQARHFAALVQILVILQEFEDSYLARAMFLKRLKYVAELSSAKDPVSLKPLLSHGGLLLINSFVRQEVQTHFDRTKALAKGVAVSKTLVDSLKVFALLQQQSRSTVISWLRSWLFYNDDFEHEEFPHLKEQDMDALSTEVIKTWFSGMKDES